jgi:citrate lyase subunit beta/citryl-CoA lyase
MTARSYLYVPGDQPDKLAKAVGRGADAIIVDLEDAVAFSSKATARRITSEWLRAQAEAGPEIWVRINNHEDLMADDINAVVGEGLTGLYIPKADGPDAIDAVAQLVSAAAAHQDPGIGSIKLGALIETARGVQAVDRIAAHRGLTELAIGEADLGAELGIRASPDEREWLAIRSRVLVACAAAGIKPPVGPVSVDFRDLDAFRASTEGLKRMGFRSRPAVHPAQVAVINDVFTPTAGEATAARLLVADYDTAVAEGRGVILDPQGRMVDEATVREARRILRLVAGTGELDS